MKKIRYLDMFAGVGGFRSGLTNAGDFFVPVGWCEIDPFAQKAYRALYETEGEYFCDDATRIKCEDLPEIDLITAGFPCQPFSVSGRRLGFADTRGTLFHEIVRVAEARRPPYLLLENVPGLLNHEGGKTFGTILAAIHELGYSLEWCVLNSTNFGVPQQRRRVYIVGYLDSRLSGKIFPLTQSHGATLKQVIPGGQGQRVYSPEGASTCLTSQGGGWGAKTGLYFVDMNADPKVTHEARCITARQDSGISNRKGEHSGVIITGARAVLTPERENVRQQGRRMKEPDEPMFTLTAMDKHGVEYNGRVRRLMPKECFRLQGYTDEQFDKLVEIGIPEAQLYKMAGNSVTTNVVILTDKSITFHYENGVINSVAYSNISKTVDEDDIVSRVATFKEKHTQEQKKLKSDEEFIKETIQYSYDYDADKLMYTYNLFFYKGQYELRVIDNETVTEYFIDEKGNAID